MSQETRKLNDLVEEVFGTSAISLEKCGINDILSTGRKAKVNIIALGDVGTNVLMGLKLMGHDVIEEIGIFDLNQAQLERLELEFNQMAYPPDVFDDHNPKMPTVKVIKEEEIPCCDVIVFCATKGIPEIGVKGDVRMMQLEANLSLVKSVGEKIANHPDGFSGLIAVVSDPVDQLCKGMLEATDLSPGQIRGFGMGVMAARARYYAAKDERFKSFLEEGRAFGPHGQDLVIANSLDNYDDTLSREITKMAVEANLKVRELGFKPFLAPAISSAAISILLTIRGKWNYGSVFFGDEENRGAFVGTLSRLTPEGVEYEDRELPLELYDRIKTAYINLVKTEI